MIDKKDIRLLKTGRLNNVSEFVDYSYLTNYFDSVVKLFKLYNYFTEDEILDLKIDFYLLILLYMTELKFKECRDARTLWNYLLRTAVNRFSYKKLKGFYKYELGKTKFKQLGDME